MNSELDRTYDAFDDHIARAEYDQWMDERFPPMTTEQIEEMATRLMAEASDQDVPF